jgi:hypothetical protein
MAKASKATTNQCAAIGAQDANVSNAPIHVLKTPASAGCERSGYQYSWRSGCHVFGKEFPVYTALLTRYQIGILRGARSNQLKGGFTKQTLYFEESQEFQG